MRRRKDEFRRPERSLALGPRVLVACEGTRTEPRYLNGIRISQRLSERQIEIIPHQGTDPPNVVRAVAERRRILRRERRWDNTVDTAWAVFDDDDWQAQHAGQWNDATQRARAWGIRLIVSNPCFELWYLLHFRDQTAALTRQSAVSLLKQHVPAYEKSASLYPDPLRERTQAAIDRSDQLAERAARDELGDFPNPSTNVAELVRHLLSMRPRPS